MIYQAFLAVVATLLVAPTTQGLPASFKYASEVSTTSPRSPEPLHETSYILHRSHNEPSSRFTKNDNHIHRNSLRNGQFPPIFYPSQRRDTANDTFERKETGVNLLSDQNGSPPPLDPPTPTSTVQQAPPNTSITLIPRPTTDSHGKVNRVAAKKGIKAGEKGEDRQVIHRKESRSTQA